MQDFRVYHGVVEAFIHLECYMAYTGSWLPTAYQSHVQGTSNLRMPATSGRIVMEVKMWAGIGSWRKGVNRFLQHDIATRRGG